MDVRKSSPGGAPTTFAFMTGIPHDPETFIAGGRTILLDRERRKSSLASRLGKIGGQVIGQRIHEAYQSNDPTPEQQKIIADSTRGRQAGGQARGDRIHEAHQSNDPTPEQRQIIADIKRGGQVI